MKRVHIAAWLLAGAALVGAAVLASPRGSGALERVDEIAAPPATVYELLTDLRSDRRWSPWRDAHSRYLFSGPPFGAGSAVEWSGGSRGSSTVVRADPYSRVEHDVSLGGRRLRSAFTLTRSAQGTRIAWRVETGGGNLIDRWTDRLAPSLSGADLERGLDRLGDVAESLPHVDLESYGVRLAQAPSERLAYVEGQTQRDPAAIAQTFSRAVKRVRASLLRAGLKPASGPVWTTTPTGENGRVRYRAGYVVGTEAPSSIPGVTLDTVPSGWAVIAEHRGAFEALGQAEPAMRLFQGLHQLPSRGPTLVTFSGEPATTPSDRLVIRLRTAVSGGA